MSSATSRMVQLLGAFRRERNGLVADTMHYKGVRYGLNYGVSLPTVRRLVHELEPNYDDALAAFLATQEVRCLRLAALHLVDPESLHDSVAADRWLAFLTNSELAEEAAYALLSRSSAFDALFRRMVLSAQPYASYALLMAAARRTDPSIEWLELSSQVLMRQPDRLLMQAVTGLWAHLANHCEAWKEQVNSRLLTLSEGPIADYLRDELAWRIL